MFRPSLKRGRESMSDYQHVQFDLSKFLCDEATALGVAAPPSSPTAISQWPAPTVGPVGPVGSVGPVGLVGPVGPVVPMAIRVDDDDDDDHELSFLEQLPMAPVHVPVADYPHVVDDAQDNYDDEDDVYESEDDGLGDVDANGFQRVDMAALVDVVVPPVPLPVVQAFRLPCSDCGLYEGTVACTDCQVYNCLRCFEAHHFRHCVYRGADVYDRFELMDDGNSWRRNILVKPNAMGLCGHRSSYTLASCAVCTFGWRASVPKSTVAFGCTEPCLICLSDESKKITAVQCGTCHKKVCDTCWRDCSSASNMEACFYCRAPML